MKFFTSLLLFVSLTTFAQSKSGTIDVDYIITQMPEFTTVQSSLEVYGNQLDADFQIKIKEYDTLIKAYNEAEASLTEEAKKEKQQALLTLDKDITNFKNNGVKLLQIKRDEALRPLYQKIGGALEKVAKTQAYTLVMQIDDSMVYIDPSTDLTRGVLTQLGITIKE